MKVVSVNAVVQVLRFDFCMIESLHSASLIAMKMTMNLNFRNLIFVILPPFLTNTRQNIYCQ